MDDQTTTTSEHDVEQALTQAVSAYFDDCRGGIPAFIQQHFLYPGCWHTNKRALGWDLVRAPLNLFWAPIYLCLQLLAIMFGKLKLKPLQVILRKTPSGITTQIQTYLTEQTFTQLLGRHPMDNEDKLFSYLSQAFKDLPGHDLPGHGREMPAQYLTSINTIVHDALEQYRITRTASADIGNSLLSTVVGGFAFQKFTPGGFAVGLAIAAWLSQLWAVDSFFLGEWLGRLYYSFFPPSPSLELRLFSIILVMTCLAVFASFSGLITDPIQSWTGLHRKRLHKMIDQLERDFLQKKVGGFRPKDQFVARILEVVDAAKAHLF